MNEVKRIVPNLHSDAPDTDLLVDVLGLKRVMDHGWIQTFASPAGAQLSVMSDEASAPVRPDVSIEVADVDAVHAAAVERGYEIVHPLTDEPWGVRRFFVRDAGGHVINVLTHKEP